MKGIHLITLFFAGVFLAACGAADISADDVRKAERFYQAAYVAWFDEHNNLEAIRHLTRSVDANPNNDNAHYLLGTIRLGRSEYDLAEKHLRMALKLRDTSRPAERVEALNSMGVLLILTRQLDEAVVMLEEAAAEVLNREPWLAMGNLGWAYIELGEYDKAVEILRLALFDQPLFCVGKFRLGEAYYHKGEYQMALGSLEGAIEITNGGCDQMQETHQLLGMTHLRLNNETDAKDAFERCREIDPTSEVGAGCAKTLAGL